MADRSAPDRWPRRGLLSTSVVLAVVAVVVYGALVAVSAAGAGGPALDVVALVGVAGVVAEHLWASRWRWLASIALSVLPGFALFAAHAAASRDGEPGLVVAALAVGGVLMCATSAVAVWIGNRWGPSGPLGDLPFGV